MPISSQPENGLTEPSSPPPLPNDKAVALFQRVLFDRSPPSVPEDTTLAPEAQGVYDDLAQIREILGEFARGNFDNMISFRGAIAGCLKTLQANLRHLAWQARQVAAGDFSQRVDFMGDFSTAFNSMVVQLEQSLQSLKERESSLLETTRELQAEIKSRKEAEKFLRRSEERWNLAVQCSRDGIWDINVRTGEGWYSERFREMFDYTPEDIPADLRWDRFFHPEDEETGEKIADMFTGKAPLEEFSVELRMARHDGNYIWVRMRGMPVHEEDDGPPYRMIGVTSDITLQKEAEHVLAFQAMHDRLTGLPNRYLLDDRLRQHVAQALRDGTPFALVVLDLDDFKGVNDTWGHGAGDKLLVEVANRIKACMRETDTAARLGGDEFVFVYTCPPNEETAATTSILDRLFESFQIPVDLGVTEYLIGSSAGIAFFPKHTTDVKRLFELADEALYQSKNAGKNAYTIWTPES